jgi:transposase
MRPFSIDLRERIVTAYLNQEGSYAVLAARFSVSRAVVGKLVRQHREQGTLQSQVHRRGRKAAIRGPQEEALRRHVREYPDATLAERIAALGLRCSVKTMWKTLRRLGWRFKKSHRGLPSKPVPTSLGNAASGNRLRNVSTQSGSFLWMKPG